MDLAFKSELSLLGKETYSIKRFQVIGILVTKTISDINTEIV